MTGCQMAHVTCLAAARHACSRAPGWDVEAAGCRRAADARAGQRRAPRHDRPRGAAARPRHRPHRARRRRRRRAHAARRRCARRCAAGDGPTIVCAQAGDVNSGALRSARRGRATPPTPHGAWVHVDGAFGLWAAASRATRGTSSPASAGADSWATDAHKWLNVPYDCGPGLRRATPSRTARAMGASAAYLRGRRGARDAIGLDAGVLAPRPRRSRSTRRCARSGATASPSWSSAAARARGASPRSSARRTASRCSTTSSSTRCSCASATTTRRPTPWWPRVQAEGTCWMGPTTWRGRRAMRISVSNWATTIDDVDRSCAAILDAAHATTRSR